MSYKVNYVINTELLDSFYEGSDLTLEGLDIDSLSDYADFLNKNCGLKDNAVFHIIKGNFMNNHYNLSGSNAYPEDLNIVVIRLNDLRDYKPIVIKRFDFGGRWFDDIIDNNLRRAGFVSDGLISGG